MLGAWGMDAMNWIGFGLGGGGGGGIGFSHTDGRTANGYGICPQVGVRKLKDRPYSVEMVCRFVPCENLGEIDDWEEKRERTVVRGIRPSHGKRYESHYRMALDNFGYLCIHFEFSKCPI